MLLMGEEKSQSEAVCIDKRSLWSRKRDWAKKQPEDEEGNQSSDLSKH
jgi:hypothetical protein